MNFERGLPICKVNTFGKDNLLLGRGDYAPKEKCDGHENNTWFTTAYSLPFSTLSKPCC